MLGEPGRHYILVPKQARRKWKSEDAPAVTAHEIADATGINKDMLFESKLKSPAQVEKLVGKPAMAKVADLIVAESSGTNLVRADKTTRAALPPPAQRFFKPETE